MSAILVIGMGPTPAERLANKIYAPGLRLWNFIQVLLKNDVEIIVAEAVLTQKNTELKHQIKTIQDRNISWYSISFAPREAAEQIRKIALQDNCRAIISTTEVINAAVGLSELALPKWLDFNGDPMAERQLQAAVYNSDAGLLNQWELMLPALLAGDKFSTCSEPQKYSLIGQLSACGRLNRHTAGYQLVEVLPPGPTHLEFPPPQAQKLLRGKLVSEDAFILLWTGGYNTWTDIDTLYKGIVYAMERNPKIEYVSTGGSISGHDEITFDRFRQLVLNSTFRDRFHFVGWVELALLPQYYYEANAAINIDYFSYEGLLGCRNRLFDWLICELPVITTALSEITQLLVKKELVASFPIGDSQAMGRLILDLAQNIDKYKERARRAREFLLTEYTNDRLLAPLVSWAKNPYYAPDLTNKDTKPNPLMTAQLNLVKQGSLLQSLQEQLAIMEAKLNTIKGSRAFRLLNKFKKFF